MKQDTTVELLVFGDYSLFSDPVTRVGGEKTTYQVPTYEALKGIMSSVYWKPTFVWYIDAVRVLNPIQMVTKGVRPIHYQDRQNELAYYTYLKDCAYQVRAHFEWNLNRPELAQDRDARKHLEMARRSVRKGGRRDVYLGTRECQAYVEPCVFGKGPGHYDDVPEIAQGLMYHGITYADEAYSPQTQGRMFTRFWDPVMKKGIIEFIRPEECKMMKEIRAMTIKPFGPTRGNFAGLAEFASLGQPQEH